MKIVDTGNRRKAELGEGDASILSATFDVDSPGKVPSMTFVISDAGVLGKIQGAISGRQLDREAPPYKVVGVLTIKWAVHDSERIDVYSTWQHGNVGGRIVTLDLAFLREEIKYSIIGSEWFREDLLRESKR